MHEEINIEYRTKAIVQSPAIRKFCLTGRMEKYTINIAAVIYKEEYDYEMSILRKKNS